MWSNVSQSKYRSAPYFGKIGMKSQRFDMLQRHFQWSHHPDVRYEGNSNEAHWWKLIEDFVNNCNEYRA